VVSGQWLLRRSNPERRIPNPEPRTLPPVPPMPTLPPLDFLLSAEPAPLPQPVVFVT